MVPEPGEVYRHFKGGIYEILNITRHTETEELTVNYKHLNHKGDPYWEYCGRPLSMWYEEVEYQGKKVPRFTKIIPETYPIGTPYPVVKDDE
jgi:hypothetical protein